jgi:hypothetical protein
MNQTIIINLYIILGWKISKMSKLRGRNIKKHKIETKIKMEQFLDNGKKYSIQTIIISIRYKEDTKK